MAKSVKKGGKPRTKKSTAKKAKKTAGQAKAGGAAILSMSKNQVKELARRFKEKRALHGNVGKGVRDEMAEAKTKGLDTVAFRRAYKFIEEVQADAAKGSLRMDHFNYVLECLGFEDHYMKPLPFKQKNNNGKGKEPEQTDLKDRTDVTAKAEPTHEGSEAVQ
jgi:hypothetical protein